VNDSVAVDAKRILLRYGAPIAVLDNVTDEHRVEFARAIAKTTLADREPRLKELLIEHGYVEAP
jgi:bifunctional DNase/RNase